MSAGALLPLDRGAAGTIIRAFDDNESGARYDSAREKFSAMSNGERDPDCAAIASPVFGPDDTLIGALSVSGPKLRFTEDGVASMSRLVLQGVKPVDAPTRRPQRPDGVAGRWRGVKPQCPPCASRDDTENVLLFGLTHS